MPGICVSLVCLSLREPATVRGLTPVRLDDFFHRGGQFVDGANIRQHVHGHRDIEPIFNRRDELHHHQRVEVQIFAEPRSRLEVHSDLVEGLDEVVDGRERVLRWFAVRRHDPQTSFQQTNASGMFSCFAGANTSASPRIRREWRKNDKST
jgi:hypothetical protein